MTYEKQLIRFMGRKTYVPLSAQEIAKNICPEESEAKKVRRELRELVRAGRVVKLPDKRFLLPKDEDHVVGRILMNRRGGGRVIVNDAKQRVIEIAPNSASTAMHNDRVLVLMEQKISSYRSSVKSDRFDTRLRGKVVKVLERARTQIVGILDKSRQLWFVIPNDPRISHDIYLPNFRQKGKVKARRGDSVVVEITEWPSRHNAPEGKLVEVLGGPKKLGVDVDSIIRQYELTTKFSARVLAEANRLGDSVNESDLKGRLDCRDDMVITIDPFDARDFDDAISVVRIEGRRWKVWVHIADVSHYVRPDSALDKEARSRGNSTYLVDRVIPMLPEALSNELCSLKPNVDRLARSVEFVLTESGRIEKVGFHSTVIRSKHRYSYEEALSILKRSPDNDKERMIHNADRLAQKLRKIRFRSGALNLDVPEHKVVLDNKGNVKEIKREENDISHQLIEEFMLLANEAVAKEAKRRRAKVLHRIHEAPDNEKLDNLRAQAVLMGLRAGNLADQKQAGKFLNSLKGHPLEDVFRIGYLRCMKRACYSMHSVGHYGLAKKDYVHFTSPIRRYADLVVHRTVYQGYKNKAVILEEVADHISLTERNSSDAELDSKLVKLLSHLQRQIDRGQREIYSGLVTEVRNIGAMIDIVELGIKGLVKRFSMTDDHYRYSSDQGRLVGRLRGNEISPGLMMKVQIDEVDLRKKQADFIVVKGNTSKGKSKVRRNHRKSFSPNKKNKSKNPENKKRRK